MRHLHLDLKGEGLEEADGLRLRLDEEVIPKKCPAFRINDSLVCLAVEPVAIRQRACSSNSGRMPLFNCSCRTAHILTVSASVSLSTSTVSSALSHCPFNFRCNFSLARRAA